MFNIIKKKTFRVSLISMMTYLIYVVSSIVYDTYLHPTPEDYYKSYNEERKKIGLPIIPDTWEIRYSAYLTNNYDYEWRIPKFGYDTPAYFTKYIHFYRPNDNIAIFKERDDYLVKINGVTKVVSISYNYKSKEWKYHLRPYPMNYHTKYEILTQVKAYQILKDNNLKILNY